MEIESPAVGSTTDGANFLCAVTLLGFQSQSNTDSASAKKHGTSCVDEVAGCSRKYEHLTRGIRPGTHLLSGSPDGIRTRTVLAENQGS